MPYDLFVFSRTVSLKHLLTNRISSQNNHSSVRANHKQVLSTPETASLHNKRNSRRAEGDRTLRNEAHKHNRFVYWLELESFTAWEPADDLSHLIAVKFIINNAGDHKSMFSTFSRNSPTPRHYKANKSSRVEIKTISGKILLKQRDLEPHEGHFRTQKKDRWNQAIRSTSVKAL